MPSGYPGLLEFLGRSLRGGDKQVSLADQSLMVYALSLAGEPDAARHALLFEKRAQLPRESRALLALAILQSGGPAPMVKDLLNPKSRAPEDASPFGSPSRERAIRLLAWSSFQPHSNETSQLVKELLASGKNGRQGSTQDNAWALLAIENYFRKSEAAGREGKPVEGTLTCGRAEVPFRLTSEVPAVFRSFPVAPGTATAQVDNPSKGQLFGETTFAVYPPLGEQPRQDRGYSVSRRYSKIGADGTPGPATGLKVGDRVLVTLRVESSLPGSFVAIDDPLPSILEAVNPDFKSRRTGEDPGMVSEGSSNYREIRADRVVYFCNQLPAGAFVFQYLARVRAAGEACAAATNVGEMYRPERFGLGTLERISSVPATVP